MYWTEPFYWPSKSKLILKGYWFTCPLCGGTFGEYFDRDDGFPNNEFTPYGCCNWGRVNIIKYLKYKINYVNQ
jgi:hypothetical protein